MTEGFITDIQQAIDPYLFYLKCGFVWGVWVMEDICSDYMK